MVTQETVSVSEIPSIQRRKSTTDFTELDTRLATLKAGQAYVFSPPRTKKNDLNRQVPVKVAKHLGESWTVTSRMGSQLLKQNPQELYVYIFKTPPTQKS